MDSYLVSPGGVICLRMENVADATDADEFGFFRITDGRLDDIFFDHAFPVVPNGENFMLARVQGDILITVKLSIFDRHTELPGDEGTSRWRWSDCLFDMPCLDMIAIAPDDDADVYTVNVATGDLGVVRRAKAGFPPPEGDARTRTPREIINAVASVDLDELEAATTACDLCGVDRCRVCCKEVKDLTTKDVQALLRRLRTY